jgi:hypothetical protein
MIPAQAEIIYPLSGSGRIGPVAAGVSGYLNEHVRVHFVGIDAGQMAAVLMQRSDLRPHSPPVYEGPERRSGIDRRLLTSEQRHPDRRSFGRRASDLPTWGVK